MTTQKPFEFIATYSRYEHAPDNGGWEVTLPHQCYDWAINGEYEGSKSRAESIVNLTRFIAEAQDLLTLLSEMDEDPEGFGYWSFPDE